MDRRRGQDGQIFQKGRARTDKWDLEVSAYLRYLVDIPGQNDRKPKCVEFESEAFEPFVQCAPKAADIKRLNEPFSEEELKRFPLFAPLAVLRS